MVRKIFNKRKWWKRT